MPATMKSNPLVGRKIIEARLMHGEEMSAMGWEHERYPGMILTLDDNTHLIMSRDEEGNGPGTIMRATEDSCEPFIWPPPKAN